MRKGAGHPDCPARENENFLAYLHRYAQFQGYLSADAPLPAPFRSKDRRGFDERLEAIFAPRQPGEDGEPAVGSRSDAGAA